LSVSKYNVKILDNRDRKILGFDANHEDSLNGWSFARTARFIPQKDFIKPIASELLERTFLELMGKRL